MCMHVVHHVHICRAGQAHAHCRYMQAPAGVRRAGCLHGVTTGHAPRFARAAGGVR